jgi:hypothetical protein
VTRQQRRALAAYVREVMDIVGLPHWKLLLRVQYPGDSRDDSHGNPEGYCLPIYGQHTAEMWFDPELPDQEPGRARYVIVHEVAHIFFDEPWRAWADPLSSDGLIPRTTYDALAHGGVRAWEHAVDLVARALTQMIPLLDWTAKPAKDWVPHGKDADGDMMVVSRMWRDAGHPTPG